MSKLYITPDVGAETVIIPVAKVQVGCVAVAVGAVGEFGATSILIDVATDSHPAVFFTLTKYVPAANAVLDADVP